MKGDQFYQQWTDVKDCPKSVITRLEHYFLTYKDMPGMTKSEVEITHTYGREEALEVIKLSQEDYKKHYSDKK